MAALFTLPQKARPRDLCEALAPSVDKVRTEIEGRAKLLDDAERIARETREAEVRTIAARKQIYSLLVEKLRASEAEASDEMLIFVGSTLEELTKDKVKPKGSP